VLVAIVLVGDELIEGRAADSNGTWAARRLTEAGAEVQGIATVGDDPAAIARAVAGAAALADAVLVSGGLGPTDDDVTREGIAEAAGAPLVEDAGAWAAVEASFRRRGRVAAPVQRRQALVPRGASWLENPTGTAPGLRVVVAGRPVFALPGVPTEMRDLFDRHVLPALRGLARLEPVEVRRVRTAGLPEAEVAALLGNLGPAGGARVGYYPHGGEVEVVLFARGADAALRADRAEAEARRRLGDAAFAVPPGGAIEDAVVAMLRDRHLGVTTAESVTGGLVARMITSVAGASDVFPGGWVVYSDAAKRGSLGVPADLLARHGAVSPEVARAMAEGARARAGTAAALATTGAAGPGDLAWAGGAPIPEGTVLVALALESRPTEVHAERFGPPRGTVQRRGAVAALDCLRRALLRRGP
jgi:nicotinamide-nucleotide amidase